MAAEKVGEFREGEAPAEPKRALARRPPGACIMGLRRTPTLRSLRLGGSLALPFSIRHKSLANNTSKAGRSLRGEGRFESRN
jgi:hypothetical protein